jgi:hypothetical protein
MAAFALYPFVPPIRGSRLALGEFKTIIRFALAAFVPLLRRPKLACGKFKLAQHLKLN